MMSPLFLLLPPHYALNVPLLRWSLATWQQSHPEQPLTPQVIFDQVVQVLTCYSQN